MILLTGATGTVGRAVLRRLTDAGSEPVRCLVRDPRRLGADRVRVQLALGDLADPGTFRHALRGVQTVIHLGASIRDQPSGSLEALNGLATLRLVRAAERAGASRFVFFSAMGATAQSGARFMRSKAKAAAAVAASDLQTTVFAPSIVYTPGDPWLSLLERLSLLPALPVSGDGRAVYQPIWAEDVADCVVGRAGAPGRRRPPRVRPGRAAVAVLRRHRARGAAPPGPLAAAGARAAAGGARGADRRRAGAWGPRRRPPGRRPS